ncbi:MAG: ABC transporter permease [Eubacteriales bacterium]|nr:ABC transporter permease [Eubacteriales bacterium]
MIALWQKHPEKIIDPLLVHIKLVTITLVISILIALIIIELVAGNKKLEGMVNHIFALIYTIPSLALFSILIPFTGLGMKTAVIVMVIYNQYILLKNIITGLNEVDAGVREAAKGIGMTRREILWIVQIPLAKQAIFAGIRLAVISTIGIGTIASVVNAGGLGDLLFSGLRTMNSAKIYWGVLLASGMTILFNAVLKKIENFERQSVNEKKKGE